MLVWEDYAPWFVYLGLILTAVLRFRLDPAKHYALWNERRATAEALRREIFKRIFDEPLMDAPDGGRWELLLKLEYFRRWQGELQREYFLKRRYNHQRTLRRGMYLNGLSIAIFLLLGLVLLASTVSSWDEQGASGSVIRGPLLLMSRLRFAETWESDYWLLVIGALTVSAWFYTSLLNSIGAAKRNVPRYENMGENFAALLGDRLAAARKGALRGEQSAVRDYVDRVHAVMALELNDWVRLADLDLGLDSRLLGASEGAHPS